MREGGWLRAGALWALLPLAGGCAVRGAGGWPVAPGGSVTDFDRSAAGAPSYSDTATPAGARDTIGIASTEGDGRTPRYVERTQPITPGPDRALLAGPPQLGRLIPDPETIRALQRSLAERGYFQGPLDGVASPALTDAIARFQADGKLPATGHLDGATAAAPGVPLPPPPLPPRSG